VVYSEKPGPSTPLRSAQDDSILLEDAQKATTGLRAQHSMMDGNPGLGTEWKSVRAHQIDNLERGTVSATVKDEVNSDFDCCIALSTAC
jgi:hypothetical protein